MINNRKDFMNLLETKRNAGKVTCCVRKMDTTGTAVVDSFVKELGFRPIGEKWEQITQHEARNILMYLFSMDMAYDAELESKPLADELSDYFLSTFSLQSKIFTAGYFEENSGFFKLQTWEPITDATFDTGIVVLDANKIGILWVEDED
ncbi:hypothetical protein [Pseudobacillus wudalianchiensis]|uniref:Uncharacterized protein n=1 Tax=Pseudobacillus wudalianchiensis TaxID=1743143 RepID=A0A1B9AMP7_9BACI|nr:hypothetical protein [Bacillus wudalianchiensis]OCA85076.1 hypothetical protein A8F95_10320 [Bacillus wudalianchiensis]